MLDVLKNYYFLLRIDKPIGVYLLLWPSLSAIWLASLGRPDILIIIVFCLGCFLTRSAGVVINDLLDQKLDRKVLRTFNRPIANKSVSNTEAILILFVLASLAASLLFFLSYLSILVAFFCILLICLLYTSPSPRDKRQSRMPSSA